MQLQHENNTQQYVGDFVLKTMNIIQKQKNIIFHRKELGVIVYYPYLMLTVNC